MNQNEKKPLVILTGPTAVGKTVLSINLAKRINGEIISADSMQIYKYMDIGTAKITREEMDGVRHFLVDELEPDEEFNVVVFQKMAKAALQDIYSRGKVPIVVGGTGFYIQALLYDIDFTDTKKDSGEKTAAADTSVLLQEDKDCCHSGNEQINEYRKKLGKLADEKGGLYLHQMLKEVDEEAADKIHPNNVKRIIRALEYFHETGKKISEHNKEQQEKVSPYNFVYFVLNNDRDILYKRIDTRVDKMFEAGLVREVESLRQKGYNKELVSMQGIGYKEIFDYLDGAYDEEMAEYVIKRDTRHFAKRQLTWFRRESDVCWMNYQDYSNSKEKMLEAMLDILDRHGIAYQSQSGM